MSIPPLVPKILKNGAAVTAELAAGAALVSSAPWLATGLLTFSAACICFQSRVESVDDKTINRIETWLEQLIRTQGRDLREILDEIIEQKYEFDEAQRGNAAVLRELLVSNDLALSALQRHESLMLYGFEQLRLRLDGQGHSLDEFERGLDNIGAALGRMEPTLARVDQNVAALLDRQDVKEHQLRQSEYRRGRGEYRAELAEKENAVLNARLEAAGANAARQERPAPIVFEIQTKILKIKRLWLTSDWTKADMLLNDLAKVLDDSVGTITSELRTDFLVFAAEAYASRASRMKGTEKARAVEAARRFIMEAHANEEASGDDE